MADGTLHGQAPPAAGEGAGRPSPARFTALELAVAEQLIHLSESSSSAAFTPLGAPGIASAASAASASSSPCSVNAPAPAGAAAPSLEVAGDDEEEDEQEVGGSRRRNKRNRPLAEIYAETKPIGGAGRKGKPRPTGDGKEKARK
ncbi:hypothetical protein ACP70R_001338 [Stipagrostis hirtigluma subsp. patula]